MKIVFKESYLERPQPIILRPNTKLESCKRSKMNYIQYPPHQKAQVSKLQMCAKSITYLQRLQKKQQYKSSFYFEIRVTCEKFTICAVACACWPKQISLLTIMKVCPALTAVVVESYGIINDGFKFDSALHTDVGNRLHPLSCLY